MLSNQTLNICTENFEGCKIFSLLFTLTTQLYALTDPFVQQIRSKEPIRELIIINGTWNHFEVTS